MPTPADMQAETLRGPRTAGTSPAAGRRCRDLRSEAARNARALFAGAMQDPAAARRRFA